MTGHFTCSFKCFIYLNKYALLQVHEDIRIPRHGRLRVPAICLETPSVGQFHAMGNIVIQNLKDKTSWSHAVRAAQLDVWQGGKEIKRVVETMRQFIFSSFQKAFYLASVHGTHGGKSRYSKRMSKMLQTNVMCFRFSSFFLQLSTHIYHYSIGF
jgi:hypothetical protein